MLRSVDVGDILEGLPGLVPPTHTYIHTYTEQGLLLLQVMQRLPSQLQES